MKLFKDTTVKLHPIEKMFFLMCSTLIGLAFAGGGWAGYGMSQEFTYKFGCIGLIFAGIAAPILTYATINGKGLNRIKEERS